MADSMTFLLKMYRVVLIGQENAGKTSVLQRQVDNVFYQGTRQNMDIDFRTKDYDVDGKVVKMQIWVTDGHQIYRQVQKQYYKSSDAVIVCFDLSDLASFQKLSQYLREIRNQNILAKKYIFGCKSDISRIASRENIRKLALHHQASYLEVSAKNNQGINQAFHQIAAELTGLSRSRKQLSSIKIVEREKDVIEVSSEQVQNRSHFCCFSVFKH